MLQQVKILKGIIACQQIHLSEKLEGVYQREDSYKKDSRRKIPELYVQKPVQGACALQLRNLKAVTGDIIERRKEKYHVVAQIFPQKQKNDHHKALAGFHPVNWLCLEPFAKHRIEGTVIVKHYLPYQHDGSHGNHHGAEEKCSEHTFSRYLGIQQACQTQRQHHSQRNCHRRKYQCVFCRSDKGVVFEKHLIISQENKVFIYGIIEE